MNEQPKMTRPAHHVPRWVQFLFRRDFNKIDLVTISFGMLFLEQGNWLAFLIIFILGVSISALVGGVIEARIRRAKRDKQGDES